MHHCKDNVCNEVECCQAKCSDWPGVCPAGQHKRAMPVHCGDKHFTQPVSVTNNDATVTKAAADVVEAGDVLSIYEVGYSVMSVPSDTTIVLTTPYAGETNANVPMGDVKVRNKCTAAECCSVGAFCSEWSAPATCSSWMGTCPAGKQKRADGDGYTCPNGICDQHLSLIHI